jgi:deazaflavin-dependent oxidoreductase (nitroreductase family)
MVASTRIERIRPFTRLFNPLMRPLAARLPGFAVISYVGRRSGRSYRTPINVFRREGDYVFALTYGPDVQWVKNVLAAGTAQLEQRGRIVTLRDPRRITDPKARLVPLLVRPFLRFMRVSEFLRMSPARERSGTSLRPGHKDEAAPEGAASMLSR